MPTEHAAKIRIYTFLSDVAPEGQAKTPALFPSEQYQEMRQYSSEYCSDRTSKNLFCAAVGKEKILSTHKTILALLTNRLS